jgi:hypothetical protein
LNSDKFYWHQYIKEYERLVFSQINAAKNILEFGVLRGDSIRYLLDRFQIQPTDIYGVDIQWRQPSWPEDPRFKYIYQDQGDRAGVIKMFKEKIRKQFDLIIDDGSHIPEHQVNCLVAGWPYIRPGGFYIVEDIHTAFSRTELTIFNILLAIKHSKATGQPLLPIISYGIGGLNLLNEIADLHLIRRSHLPLKCWKCDSSDFNYITLRCSCGEDLYKENDSMSFVIQKK